MGYFEIGIVHCKTETNIGTLWRSAYQLGAAGIFTIGKRYSEQCSDTYKSQRHIPLRHYQNFNHFVTTRPFGALLIGVEIGGIPLNEFKHPRQAIYLLGAEDFGLKEEIKSQCNVIVSLGAINQLSYNVAVAGSIVMYDRLYGDNVDQHCH